MPPGHPWPAVAAAVGVLALAGAPVAPAQQPGPDRSCTLTLQPTDSTESVSRKVAEDTYVTHIRNGMLWLCEPATMTADSAVQYENRRTVVMIGSVHYRDTVRDLRSRRLTYFRDDDRVVAEDSVRLRQLETGSVLRGPRVEFYNAVRGEGTRETVATRRPRMLIPAPDDTAGEPFRVVADTAVFFGERRARAAGDVEIRRDGLTAEAGYARFRIREGSGFLTRSPVVEAEDFRLTGDTVRVGFEGTELRTVRAVGRGHLTGEEVEVRAPRLDIRVTDDQVDELWAYGPGRARAFSGRREVRGDSLHFSFDRGRLSGIVAVGSAVALEASDDALASAPRAEAPEPGGRPGLDTRRNWITGDTVRARFAAADPREASRGPDSAGAGAAAGRAEPEAAGGRAERAPAGAIPAEDDTARTQIERLVAVGDARSFYRIRPDSGRTGERPPDREGEAREGRVARNYMIGDRITIRFAAGRPLSVRGTRAIGLYMEPVGRPGPGGAGATAPDSAAGDGRPGAGVPGDTASFRPPRVFDRGTFHRTDGIIGTGGMIYE